MKAILKHKDNSDLDIVVIDTEDLISSQYYEVLNMTNDDEFIEQLEDGDYVFNIDDVAYSISYFIDWLTRDFPKLASDTFMDIIFFDDVANSRIIGLRKDKSKFIINYGI